ncbi:MAG: hypothetical protein DMF86_11010 [Acidobacteria bacterium]|nr:MAG: hypothetical protein DMF86_11010 [Acidobacteriota bacterium]
MARVWRVAIVAAIVACLSVTADAQRRRTPAKKKSAPPALAPPIKVAADIKCPSLLGAGVKTARTFCDVPAGRDPQQGVIVTLPPHAGPATLAFNLHARHMYSEQETRAGRGYSRYAAIIGVLAITGELISRAAVQAEFRTAADLYDRIAGGAGPGGVKAVAPAGDEAILIAIPAGVDQVSLLGETLDATTPAGHETMVLPGRPVAIVSNMTIEYRPVKKRAGG